MEKKVWIFNHYATTMFFNCNGRHHNFAKCLNLDGYDTTIFCANTIHNSLQDPINIGNELYIEKTSADGIRYVFIKTVKYTGNGKNRIKNMVMFAINLYKVAREYAIKNGRPDILIPSSVHPLTLVSGLFLKRHFHVPCIGEVRDLWPEYIFLSGRTSETSILGKLLIAGEHWIYRNVDQLIFTKEGDHDYLIERGWDTNHGGDIDLAKCHYINNGVDLAAFNSKKEKNVLRDADLQNDKFKVCYIGAISPANDVGCLLDAAKLLAEYADIEFIIYGDGVDLPDLMKRVKEEKLANVKLKGFINNKYAAYILSCSSVNVLNYSQKLVNWKRGNSSNKLFEYMASGKPIIATVHMGYSIINKYHCGVEMDENTPEELARQVLRFYSMKSTEYQQLGQNAKDGAKDFDFANLTKKLEAVIHQCQA